MRTRVPFPSAVKLPTLLLLQTSTIASHLKAAALQHHLACSSRCCSNVWAHLSHWRRAFEPSHTLEFVVVAFGGSYSWDTVFRLPRPSCL